VKELFDDESRSNSLLTPPNQCSGGFLYFLNKKVKTNKQLTSFGNDKNCLCVPIQSFDGVAGGISLLQA
jgi:hypothetical protein